MVLEAIGGLFLVIGFFLFLGAFVIPVVVGLNIRGYGERAIASSPRIVGFRSRTRWKSAIASFGYLFIISLLLLGVGTGLTPDTDPATTDDIDAEATPSPIVDEKQATTEESSNGSGDETTESSSEPASTATSPSPTDSPAPTATPTESPTPTASTTASPTPKPKKAPDGESYAFDGSGATATNTFTTDGGLVTFDLSHNGDSNFAVWLLNGNGEKEELLVNTIGSWDGKVVMYLPAGTYLLDVEADGSWDADVSQPRYSSAEVDSLPQSSEGDDSTYIGPFSVDGLTRVEFVAEDDEHYAVWLKTHRGENMELLFNEIGPFEGSTAFGGTGDAIIQVRTNGEWKIVIEKG